MNGHLEHYGTEENVVKTGIIGDNSGMETLRSCCDPTEKTDIFIFIS